MIRVWFSITSRDSLPLVEWGGCSLPPCGGGLGWGVTTKDSDYPPTLTLPHKEGGNKTASNNP